MWWPDILSFIEKYQTLIAGLIAILAAYITARPVWRQLEGMSIQANALYRDYVLEQIRRTDNRRTWYSKRLESFNEDVGRRLYEMEEREGGVVDVNWAHGAQQRATCLLDELQRHGETRDLSAVERELSEVFSNLRRLVDTLDSVHRPHSMDQHDADHSFTDEEWAELKVAAEKAEVELSGVANALSQASMRLDAAFAAELSTFRQQLKQVQASLQRVRL
jgi:hypothetical protein